LFLPTPPYSSTQEVYDRMQVFGEDAQRVAKSACFDTADSLQKELLYDRSLCEIWFYVS